MRYTWEKRIDAYKSCIDSFLCNNTTSAYFINNQEKHIMSVRTGIRNQVKQRYSSHLHI